MERHTPGAGDRSLLRRINTQAALQRFRAGPATVTELAGHLGLSRTAAEDVARDLVDLGWINLLEEPLPDTRLGRPAKTYRFAASSGHVVGVDIGPHKILAIVADLNGDACSTRRLKVSADLSTDDRLDSADRTVRACLESAGLGLDDVWRVGVGSPGVIRADGTVDRYGGTGLPGWAGTNVAQKLTQRWGVPVRVDSDNNLGIIAEHWRGSAREARNVVYVLSGNRTSAGVMVDGAIYRGSHGATGLIGSLPRLGWASAPGHVDRLAGTGVEPSREAMFEAARAGHPHALGALDGFAADLAIGIAVMALAVDPDLIVLGGGVSRGGDLILEAVRGHVTALYEQAPDLVLSTLGDESVALGAVRVALDWIDADLGSRIQASSAFPQATSRLDPPS